VQLEGVVLVDTALLKGTRHLTAIPVDNSISTRAIVEQIVAQFSPAPEAADGITLQLVVGGVPGRLLALGEIPLAVQRGSPSQHNLGFRLARETIAGGWSGLFMTLFFAVFFFCFGFISPILSPRASLSILFILFHSLPEF
jgi:hypothetical protein